MHHVDAISSYSDVDRFNQFDKNEKGPADGKLVAKPLSAVFLGNSITLHGPAPDIGWHHNNGMAASGTSTDYVHCLMRWLEVGEEKVVIANVAYIERRPLANTEIIDLIKNTFSSKSKLTIVQLGDNISNDTELSSFVENAKLVLPLIRANSEQVVMLSTWWTHAVKDSVIQQLCSIFGIAYIFIGDIFDAITNEDRRTIDYAHSGVDRHPKDWGMEQIATRIHRTVQSD
jgi:hypothetical protein